MEQHRDNNERAFQYEGYQVVRGEYFAHIAEPSVTFNHYKIYVNTACLRKAADAAYVQILVNPEERKMVVRPCCEDEKDSFVWCTVKRKPKQIVCRMFFAKMMDFMGWDPSYRYKLLGKQIVSGGERLFIFDLTAAVVFPPAAKVDPPFTADRPSTITPLYPETWKTQFGLPVETQRKIFQINQFEQFAVFSVKQAPHRATSQNESNQASDARMEDET